MIASFTQTVGTQFYNPYFSGAQEIWILILKGRTGEKKKLNGGPMFKRIPKFTVELNSFLGLENFIFLMFEDSCLVSQVKIEIVVKHQTRFIIA